MLSENKKNGNLENIVIKKTGHKHQNDSIIIMPLEIELTTASSQKDTVIPRAHLPQVYQLMIQL